MNTIEAEVVSKVHTAVCSTIDEGLGEYLKQHLFGYNSPFWPLIKDAVSKLDGVTAMLQESVTEVIQEPEFKENLKEALRKRLVTDLVKGFHLENTLKELRDKPETKQRIIAALESVVSIP